MTIGCYGERGRDAVFILNVGEGGIGGPSPNSAQIEMRFILNDYQKIIEKLFFDNYQSGATVVPFHREDIPETAKELGLRRPRNLGDVIYAVRYRTALPSSIRSTAPKNKEWIIEGAGRAKYEFRLVVINRIEPNEQLLTVKIPDATPEIVTAHALSDEQALLAKVRYNRLVDIFLGVTAYSLQNHLRTTVSDVGQIEIDEIYVAVDYRGCQYVVPVQAKGGADQLSVVQTKQDIRCCEEKYPALICRSVSTQFLSDERIAMFELTIEDAMVKIVSEEHYRLVPGRDVTDEDLKKYASKARSR